MAPPKGTTNNPNGRPKRGTSMADALRTALKSKGKDGQTKRKAVAEKVIAMALDGNVEALKLLFERIDGKVPQTNVFEGNEDAPMRVVVKWASGAEASEADANPS